MKLIALALLAGFPFLGVLLLAWIGPGHSFAHRYRRARERTAAMSEAADIQRERTAAAVAHLAATQRAVRGEEGP